MKLLCQAEQCSPSPASFLWCYCLLFLIFLLTRSLVPSSSFLRSWLFHTRTVVEAAQAPVLKFLQISSYLSSLLLLLLTPAFWLSLIIPCPLFFSLWLHSLASFFLSAPQIHNLVCIMKIFQDKTFRTFPVPPDHSHCDFPELGAKELQSCANLERSGWSPSGVPGSSL